MSINISRNRIMIICIFLMIYKMFFILSPSNPIMNLCASNSQTGVILLSFVAIIIGKRKRYVIVLRDRYSKIVLAMILLTLVECTYSLIKYQNQMPRTVIFTTAYLSAVIAFSAFRVYDQTDKETYHFILSCIRFFSSIWATLIILQSLLYKAGITILDASVYTDSINGYVKIRNGNLRISTNYHLLMFSIVLSMGFLLSSKTINTNKTVRNKYLFNILICSIAIVFVVQTRMLTAVLLIIIITDIFFANIKTKNIKTLLIVPMSIALVFVLLSNNSFLTEVLNYDQSEKSYYVRMEEYPYYFSRFKENPILGFGTITGQDLNSLSILRGDNNYSTSDVGIIGTLAKYGIVPFIVLVVIIITNIKYYFKKGLNTYHSVIPLNFAMLLVGMAISLSPFEVYTITLIPLMMYIMSCYEKL